MSFEVKILKVNKSVIFGYYKIINYCAQKRRTSQDTHGPRKDRDSHIVDDQILNSRILFGVVYVLLTLR